jgi:hypothetical protein
MELILLGVVVILCALFAQTLLIPIHVTNSFHLPLPLWLGSVQTWLGLGFVLFLGSWFLGDR